MREKLTARAERREEGGEKTIIMGTSSRLGLIAFHKKKQQQKKHHFENLSLLLKNKKQKRTLSH